MKKVKSKVGIVSYGAYLPKYRIKTEEIALTYGKDAEAIKSGLGITEKTVPGKDEDTISISVNAARQAFWRLQKEVNIGAIYVGSESHPYAVKPTSGIVGEALGIDNEYTAADLEFACKAGTAGVQMVAGLVDSGRIESGLAIGSDTAQGAPGDALEFSAASGSAAFILGRKNVIANLIHTTSYTSDTPDFWRREHQKYPSHGGRFTGEPAYFKHVLTATKMMLEDLGAEINDFDHVVFHMPNGKFPSAAAKILKVEPGKMKHGLVVGTLGNSYSACSLVGLVNVLDSAKPGEKILITSYGSGAGSDSFVFEMTEEITKYRKNYGKIEYDKSLKDMMESKIYLTYGQYVNHTRKL